MTSSPIWIRLSPPPRSDDHRPTRASPLPVHFARPDDGQEWAGALHIGLLNLLADAALSSAERQVGTLLGEASGERDVVLHLFTLPEIVRGPVALRHLSQWYGSGGDLTRSALHGLFVTGAEPRTANLRDEAFWPGLARIIDWAVAQRCPTIWSCLAAHAAVLHLDGIGRRRLPNKISGLFRIDALGESGLLAGLPPDVVNTHSRWNEIGIEHLDRAGYSTLTSSAEVGVDTFTKNVDGAAFVFLQGHPEYDDDALAREYRRDVLRFLAGQNAVYPDLPQHYFAGDVAERLLRFGEHCREARKAESFAAFPTLPLTNGRRETREFGLILFRNWLAGMEPSSAADRRRPSSSASAEAAA